MLNILKVSIIILTIAMLPGCVVSGVDGNNITISQQNSEAEFWQGAMMECVNNSVVSFISQRGMQPSQSTVESMMTFCANKVERMDRSGMYELWTEFMEGLQSQKPSGVSL